MSLLAVVKEHVVRRVKAASCMQSMSGRGGDFVRNLFVLTIFCLVAGLGMAPSSVHAATVTCTSAAADNPSTVTSVLYSAAGKTCTIANNTQTQNTGDILFVTSGGVNNAQFFGDSSLDGIPQLTDHLGCTIGDLGTVTAGGTCNDGSVAPGTYANTLKANVSAGVVATMTVNFTVVGTDVDITSASVSLPDDESSSSSSSNESISHELQASVSRSQAAVVGKNIEARVLAISRASATGGVAAPNTGGVPAPTTGDQPSSSSFSGHTGSTTLAKPAMVMKSRGTSLRELAMQASFDSSQTTLSAAGDANAGDDPLRGIEQSLGLLAQQGYTVWGHGSYTSVNNDRNNAAGDSRYDGDVWGYNLGFDVRLRPELVGGISMGYSQTALTTTYNSGYYDETNWTLSPYIVYQPAAGVTLSSIIGYSLGDIDLSRDSSVTGDTESDMWFGSLSGAYAMRPSETLPLDVTVNVNFMAARKTVDAYTESDSTQVGKTVSNTRRLKPGIEAAYSFDAAKTILQPFAKTDFVYDMTDETNGDKTAFNLGGGLRIISGATGLSGSIEGEQQLGTDDYSEYTIGGLIAYAFSVNGSEGASLGVVSPYVRSNFTPDSGQTFGTGFTFTAEDEAFSTEVNLTHTNAVSSRETVAEINITLAF